MFFRNLHDVPVTLQLEILARMKITIYGKPLTSILFQLISRI